LFSNFFHLASFTESVFDENVSTEEMYKSLAQPIVIKALEGYNGTIFAYGQTCSGKTHTMVGSSEVPGIIPLATKDIFNAIQNTDDRQFLVRIGYIEIYNDKIFDLFDNRRTGLGIFDAQGNTTIDQKEFIVTSEEEVSKYFQLGNSWKKMGETANNDNSSRSHTIFRITVESENPYNCRDQKISNIFLVDLAGSEKPDITKASFNEGLHINKALLALGKIIRELAKKNSSMKHVNFRECKLTRILSPALSGNSLTAVVCTVSPTDDETNQTISFSQNLKKIKIYPVFNIANKARMLLRTLKLDTSTSSTPSRENENLQIGSKQLHDNEQLKKQIASLERQNFEAQENLKIATELLESKNKMVDVLHVKLCQSLNHIQQVSQHHDKAMIEKENTIKVLEKQAIEIHDAYEKHLDAKNDAFNSMEKEYEDELKTAAKKVVSIRKNKDLYKKALLEREAVLELLESRIQKLVKETAEIKVIHSQRFENTLQEKDQEINSLKERINKMNKFAQDKEIEDLNVYIQLEKYYGSNLATAHENLEALKNVTEEKELVLAKKHDEIAFLQFQLNNVEKQGIEHANCLRNQFEFILTAKNNSLKEFEERKNSEMSQLKAIIDEKDSELCTVKALLVQSEMRVNEITENEIEQANYLKEKFESKLIDIDNHFVELLNQKDEEIVMLTEKIRDDVVNFHNEAFSFSTSASASPESGTESSSVIQGSTCSYCEQTFSRKFVLDRHVICNHFSNHN
jgi:Kinesin motor domain